MRASQIQSGKVLFSLTLLTMILMRLVWMDLRDYSVTVDPKVLSLIESSEVPLACSMESGNLIYPQYSLPRSGLNDMVDSLLYRKFLSFSCEMGLLRTSSYIRMNQGIFVASIVLCVLITRFFTRSWLLCLMTAAILLSRGRLISANGDLSGQALTMFLVTFWIAMTSHWQRSGSKLLGFGVIIFPLLLSLIDMSFTFLGFAIFIPYLLFYVFRKSLALPMLRQLRSDLSYSRKKPRNIDLKSNQKSGMLALIRQTLGWSDSWEWGYRPIQDRYQSGSLLRSLDVPFVLWVQHRKLWYPILGGALTACGFQLLYLFVELRSLSYSWHVNVSPLIWWGSFSSPIDLDIAVGLIIILASLIVRPVWGLISYRESCWVLVSSVVFGGLGAYLWDMLSFPSWVNSHVGLKSGEVLLWFEPSILTFAVIGVYHLFRVLDQLVRSKRQVPE